MIQCRQYTFSVGTAGALCLLIASSAARAQVNFPTVTQPSAGVFRYNYSIFNDSVTSDLFDVDIHVPIGPGIVTNITVPTVNGDPNAFMFAYDSGLGLVSFLENDSFFTPVPISGFTFDSAFGPQNSTFDAQFISLIDPNAGIVTISGNTQAPGVASTPVPEPSSIVMSGAMGLVSAFVLYRKRCKTAA